MTRLGVVCALAAVAAGCAQPDPVVDDLDGKPWEIQKTLMPPVPKDGNLIPFYVGPTPFAFLVDPVSVSVGEDRVVRYTLIARSSSGGTNVSYEGIRCRTYERRVYAFGRSDGVWSQARNSQWVPINRLAADPQTALADDFFCTQRGPVRTTDDALRALPRGNLQK